MNAPTPRVPLTLLASGRDADVFALDGGRVLRRNRDGRSPAAEAAVMRHVSAHGFPAPRVHAVEGPDLVMDRLHGPTLLGALLAGEESPAAAGRIMAGLQDRLHALPPPGDGAGAGGGAGGSGGGGAGAGGSALLHLDLHPDNIVLTGAGPVLIDWTNARTGGADLDVAMSALIMAQVALAETFPEPVPALAGAGLDAFLAHTGGDPVRLLDEAVELRAGDPNLAPEEAAVLTAAAAAVRERAANARL
ncbi:MULTISPECIES: phosphotransferase [unclassified Nocardiopsis]|uniref:phosphotransferase n=1 Tax=Nocardiopsis TaxID=2013 RepID=UPI00387A9FD1